MSDEPKKDKLASEVKTEVIGESLPESDLDKAVGGTELSLSFQKIEWTYTQQKRESDT